MDWITTSPDEGSKSVANILSRVVFPAPFGPIKATISPSPTTRSTLCKTVRRPKVLLIPLASITWQFPPARHLLGGQYTSPFDEDNVSWLVNGKVSNRPTTMNAPPADS